MQYGAVIVGGYYLICHGGIRNAGRSIEFGCAGFEWHRIGKMSKWRKENKKCNMGVTKKSTCLSIISTMPIGNFLGHSNVQSAPPPIRHIPWPSNHNDANVENPIIRVSHKATHNKFLLDKPFDIKVKKMIIFNIGNDRVANI